MSTEVVVAHPRGGDAARVLTITEETLNEGLKKASDKARREEREAQKKQREAALEAQAEAHRAELARVGAETVMRERVAHAHGFHKAGWLFGLPALIAGAIGGIASVLVSQSGAFDAGARATNEGAVSGAMIERMRGREEFPRGAMPPAPEGGE